MFFEDFSNNKQPSGHADKISRHVRRKLESFISMIVEESETEHEFDFGDTLENEFDFDENYTPSMLMQTKFTRQPEMATRETSRFN